MSIHPKHFDFTQRKWRWHPAIPELAEKLAESASPEELICVKATDTRAVYRFENYFIKVSGSLRPKAQLAPAAREEYNNYCKLQKYNIPAVRHLAWGRMGRYTALITEAWTNDACDALYYWYSLAYAVKNTDDFLADLVKFLQVLVNSPLKHGDFHLGNLLYSPSRREFTLVDLHNVSIGSEHTLAEKASMLQILVELRSALTPQKMLDMFWQIAAIDADTASKVIRKKLIRDSERNLHDWPRRVRQFLSGYNKFSDFVQYKDQVLLVKRDRLRRNLFDPALADQGKYKVMRLAFEDALEQMLFSHYLTMLQVPHNPAVALSPDGDIYYPDMKEFQEVPTDLELVNSYSEYLLCMDLHLSDYHQWRHCNSGNQLLLADFNATLGTMPDRTIFRPRGVNPRNWKVRRER